MAHLATWGSIAAILSALVVSPMGPGDGTVAAASHVRVNGVATSTAGLPSQFVDETVATGLNLPTALAFAPDGRVFVTEKRGMVKTWPNLAAFDSNAAPVLTLDLRSDVMNYWDRGLLGLTVDPGWPAKPYIYLNYTYDALPGGTAPHWNAGDPDNDPCLNPPGSTTDGCVVTSRVERVTVDTTTGAAVTRKTLLTGWCQQFPSHSAGSVQFGADGMLYVSGGEGGSFNVGSQDYGEYGGTLPDTTSPVTPKNPCGDPPAGSGGTMTPPTAEGGALRAQSFRRASTEPAVYNGAILRVDPATGNPAPDNATIGNSDGARQRIVAYGLRNPFRITFRPGTNDLYIGDVGYETWEEVDRLPNPKAAPTNFGWPCHEGPAKDTYYTSVSLNLCTSLADSAVTNPLYDYQQAGHMATGDGCPPTTNPSASASVSGLAFADGAPYPAPYDGALFVADYARNCIVILPDRGDGVPSTTAMPFESAAAAPVMLTQDPDGNIAYVDFTGGTIHRIRYAAPVAKFTATPSAGPDPLTVQFDASASSAAAGISSYDWDYGDGSAHGTGVTTSHTYAQGTWTARLTVTDTNNLTASKTQTIASGNLPPVVTLDKPTCTTSCWVVGDTIQLQAHATDPEDGTLPASAFSWHVGLEHCHTPTDCHEHDLLDPAGVTSTSIVAPDHEDGAYLRITVTVTDSGGLTDSASIDVHPKLSTLRVVSSPTGLPVTLDGTTANSSVGPVNEIVGHAATISAAPSVTSGETTWTFASWSDHGAISHVVTVPSTATTVTATYTQTASDASNTCAGAPAGSKIGVWASGRFGAANDVDWVRFSAPTAGWYRIVLGNLPVDGVLSLYSGCSTLLATVNAAGTHWEEMLAHLNAGAYAIRMSSVGGASSPTSYRYIVSPLSGTVPLLAAAYAPSSAIRLVGDVFNTSTSPRAVTVTARLYSSAGKLLKSVSVTPLIPVLPGRARSSFVIATSKPTGFGYVRFSVSSAAASRATRLLATTGVTGSNTGGGTWTVAGSVKNTSTTTATSALAIVTIDDTVGTPINATTAAPASRTLGPGASSPFSVRFSGLTAPPNGWVTRARAV
ncbi:MAG TPA: PQQ-dependent sugar dehydrogenase [Candidatus Limnocylindrales bacterium]|nr:PQQ-dependent sugar dehydrogenase [Candidatus Limnocylindrales bacterium]